jgi:hypothetical protein
MADDPSNPEHTHKRLVPASLALVSASQALVNLPAWEDEQPAVKEVYDRYYDLCRIASALGLPRPPWDDYGDHQLWARVFRLWFEEVRGNLEAKGLLLSDERVPGGAAPASEPAMPQRKRRRCYERDHIWLAWKDEGLGYAAIRDKWNAECGDHGGKPIGRGRSGSDSVRQGVTTARKERDGERAQGG